MPQDLLPWNIFEMSQDTSKRALLLAASNLAATAAFKLVAGLNAAGAGGRQRITVCEREHDLEGGGGHAAANTISRPAQSGGTHSYNTITRGGNAAECHSGIRSIGMWLIWSIFWLVPLQ